MAEDEIRKHTKAAFKVLKNPEANWKHKLKEVLIEVLIIVFAVSISIWFHNWSDKVQEHHEEKEFLTGFKKDLYSDIADIKSSDDFYKGALMGWEYFAKVGAGDTLSKDSLVKYDNIFLSTTILEVRLSRYEGLKSSGKLGIIQNKDLLNNIIELNETVLTRIQLLNNSYSSFIDKMSTFIQQNAQFDKHANITNAQNLLRNNQMRFSLAICQSNLFQNIIPAHDDGIKKCKEIIREIDKELK